MRVVFVTEMPSKTVVRDIKKIANADVVTDEKHVSTPELERNEYGRCESMYETSPQEFTRARRS